MTCHDGKTHCGKNQTKKNNDRGKEVNKEPEKLVLCVELREKFLQH